MLKKILRKNRIRRKVKINNSLPVLQVYRSNAQIYAQIVDRSGKVIASANSLKISQKKSKLEVAEIVGKNLADAAKKAKVQKVVFDRGGNKYHGRVAMLAKGARGGGLKF